MRLLHNRSRYHHTADRSIPKHWDHCYIESVRRSYRYFVSTNVIRSLRDCYLSSRRVRACSRRSAECLSIAENFIYTERYLQTHRLLTPLPPPPPGKVHVRGEVTRSSMTSGGSRFLFFRFAANDDATPECQTAKSAPALMSLFARTENR